MLQLGWKLGRNLLVFGLVSCIAACGGGGGSASAPPANIAPTIGGLAPLSARVGEQYEFLPSANDANQDLLTFSISGQPAWTSFDKRSGMLQGTPTMDDLGDSSGIVISVNDGKATASLNPFTISVGPTIPVSAPYGLDSRPANLTCLAVEAPDTANVTLQHVYPDLQLDSLTSVFQPPGEGGVWYFSTREGLIGRFANDPDVSSFTTVVDLTAVVAVVSDGGLIQAQFHPDYPTDRRIFVNYSVPPTVIGADADTIISSFELSADGMTIDPLSEEILIRNERGRAHQGGFMSFDGDGLLYLGFGDGTWQRDPTDRAQDLADLRGKILRIDVNSTRPYAIPDDNPYSGSGGNPREEIFARGLRNPWRGDIDPDSGRLYVADVGYEQVEEVSQVLSGSNLGWNIKEGTRCRPENEHKCDDTSLVDPLVEYTHDNGNCAIIGGYFYRGLAIPGIQGRFIFGDYCTSKISAVELDENGQPFEYPLLPGGAGIGNIITFAKDSDGELYAVTSSQIFKILPDNDTPGPSGPAPLLSQTGCFDPADATTPAAGLIPYDLQAPLWSDDAGKRRWFAIPEGRTIDIDADGDFLFPEGSVLVKEFSIDGAPVETRLLMRDDNGVWGGYSYEWIDDDAYLLPAGKEKILANGQTWHFPDRGECLRCHTRDANLALGPEIGQLNGAAIYTRTDRISNQLATIEHIGLFTNGLPDSPDQLPAFAGLDDTHHAVSRRARSYLHSNCSGCHQGEGATQSNMDLRYATDRTSMNICNVNPTFDDMGITGAKLLAPGEPSMSILYQRPASADPLHRMPPLGTSIVDVQAISTLSEWIQSAQACAIESDSDLDQVPNDADNCPTLSNPDQADADRDGIGDLCDSG